MKFYGELFIGHHNVLLGKENKIIINYDMILFLFRLVLPFMQSICQTGFIFKGEGVIYSLIL